MKLVMTTLVAAENNWLRLKRFVMILIILLLKFHIKKFKLQFKYCHIYITVVTWLMLFPLDGGVTTQTSPVVPRYWC